MRTSTLALLAVLSISTTAACTESTDDTESGEAAATSTNLKSRFADLRKVNTDNLARLGVNLGADQLNKALSIRTKYVDFGIDVKDTIVYGKNAEENSVVPTSGKVQSLSDVRKTLATQLGEKELPTELASLRLQHLAQGDDAYYVETGFGVKGAVKAGWSHPSGGFGPTGTLSVSLGFKAEGEVEARLLTASPSSKLKDLIELNGEAIKELRSAIRGGFVIPETKEQMLAMKPGEMVSLRGYGTYGANFGVGVPILVANAGPLAYTVAVSAGMSHAVDGDLDISMVRLGGDEVAVDVGVSDGKLNTATVGVFGGFGINHLCSVSGSETPCLDAGLGKIVGKGLLKQLSGFLRTSISTSASKGDRRIELARVRFHLNEPEVPEALTQALHGDLRYAQALYSRNLESATPPVKFDFDMMRAVTTTSRSFNAELLGINLFRKSTTTTTGAVAVQSPDGVQSVLWENISKSHGHLQKNSILGTTTISSASVTSADPDKANNEANLLVRSEVTDKRMDDDLVIDNLDALVMMIAGQQALAPLDSTSKAMQQGLVAALNADDNCKDANFTTCNADYITDTNKKIVTLDGRNLSLVEARDAGVKLFENQPALAELPDDFRELVKKAGKLRLDLAMIKIGLSAGLNNPPVDIAVNLRLDDQALNLLANVNVEKYSDTLRSYLRVISAKREGITLGKPFKDKEIDEAVLAMSALFAQHSERHKMLQALESNDLPRILAGKPYVKLPIGIRWDVSDVTDANGEDRMARFLEDEKRIRVESISHQRAIVAEELIRKLTATAKKKLDFDNLDARLFEEQAAVYPLVAAFKLSDVELGFDFSIDTSSDIFHNRRRFASAGIGSVSASARGDKVNAIRGNIFDMNEMMAFINPQK